MPKFQWTAGRVGARQALMCLRSQLPSSTTKLTRRGFLSSILRNQVRNLIMTRFLSQLPPLHTRWGLTQDPIRLTMTPKPGKDTVNRQIILVKRHLWCIIANLGCQGCSHNSQARAGRGVRKVIQEQILLKDAQNVTEIGQVVQKGVEQIIQIMAPTIGVQSQEANHEAPAMKLTGPL